MNKREARALGRDAGRSSAENNAWDAFYEWKMSGDLDDTLFEHVTSVAFEGEQNSRQFSPFEFLAHDINDSRDPEGVWEAYDQGVAAGIREVVVKFCRERLDAYATAIGIPVTR